MTPAALLAWRKRHRMTQAATASLLGISVRQMARFEAGHAAIPRTVAQACGWVEVRRHRPWPVYYGETLETMTEYD